MPSKDTCLVRLKNDVKSALDERRGDLSVSKYLGDLLSVGEQKSQVLQQLDQLLDRVTSIENVLMTMNPLSLADSHNDDTELWADINDYLQKAVAESTPGNFKDVWSNAVTEIVGHFGDKEYQYSYHAKRIVKLAQVIGSVFGPKREDLQYIELNSFLFLMTAMFEYSSTLLRCKEEELNKNKKEKPASEVRQRV